MSAFLEKLTLLMGAVKQLAEEAQELRGLSPSDLVLAEKRLERISEWMDEIESAVAVIVERSVVAASSSASSDEEGGGE